MGHKDPYEHWVNDPFVPAEKKIEMYNNSMETAMDAGRTFGIKELENYREVLAERCVLLRTRGLEDGAEKIFFALKHSYIIFEKLSEKEADLAAEEFIRHHERGEQ